MTSEPSSTDQDRPAANARMHSGLEHLGLEHLLPATMIKRSRSRSRTRPSATSQLDRSISSMTDSLMFEQRASSSRSTPPGSNTRSSSRQRPSEKDEGLTPISNWAHLSYIKSQRNALRGELRAHQIADAEARKSLASLRQRAFRMAVNVTVKEKRLATTAKNLVKSRKNHYLEGRDAEKRIEELKKALRVEEGRNQDILEALERASTLTLRYSTSEQQSPLHSPLLSPPPSPPTRLSKILPWNEPVPELAASLRTPDETQASDVRLTKAKRESVQALIACRSRIEELQAECTKRKDNGIIMDKTREALETEIQSHQARIATLEHSRAALNETLEATKSHLETTRSSEQTLEQELLRKGEEVAELQSGNLDKQKAIQNILQEKDSLEKTLQARNLDLKELHTTANAREQRLHELNHKVEVAERLEASLRGSLEDKEYAHETLRRQLDQGSEQLEFVRSQLVKYEVEAAEQSRMIETSGSAMHELRQQFEQSVKEREIAEGLMSTMKTEIKTVTSNLQREKDTHNELLKELGSLRTAQEGTKLNLDMTRESLRKETEAKNRLFNELGSLQSSRDALKLDIQIAQQQILSLENNSSRTRLQLESVRDAKATLEADLRYAREELFQSSERLTICNAELRVIEVSKTEIEQRLQETQKHVSVLVKQLDQAREDGALTDAQLKANAQQLSELQRSIESSQKLQISFQEELNQTQRAKVAAVQQHSEILEAKSELEREISGIHSKLERTQNERDGLQERTTQLDEDLNREKRQKQDLENHLNAAQVETKKLKDLVSMLEISLEGSQSSATKFEKALGIAHMENDAARKEIGGLQIQLDETKGSKENAEAKLRSAVNEGQGLKKRISTLHLTLTETKSKLGEVQSQFSTMKGKNAETQKSEREANDRLKSAQRVYDKLVQESFFTRSRLQNLEAEMQQLRSTLSTTDEELVAVHRSKAEVESQLGRATDMNTRLKTEANALDQSKLDAESRLNGALVLNAQLENNLSHSQSQIHEVNKQNADLTSLLLDAKTELEALHSLQADLDNRLKDSVSQTANINAQLESNQSELSNALSQNASLNGKLLDTNMELNAVQQSKADIEQRLADLEERSANSSTDLSTTRAALEKVEAEKATLLSQLAEATAEVGHWQQRNNQLEEQSEAASQNAADLENDFRTAQMQLEMSESENAALMSLNKQLEDYSHTTSQRAMKLDNRLQTIQMQLRDSESDSAVLGSKATAADQELSVLRDTNADLELRLASAENDLENVREMNAHLEGFLNQVEKDMATAETAVEESEQRLEEFVQESQAKLDAAQTSKLKYKARLLDQNVEIKGLISENSELRQQIGEQLLELRNRDKGKEEGREPLFAEEDRRSEGSGVDDLDEEFFDCTDAPLGSDGWNSEQKEHQSSHNVVKNVEANKQGNDTNLSAPPFASVEQKLKAEQRVKTSPESPITPPKTKDINLSPPTAIDSPSNKRLSYILPVDPQTPSPITNAHSGNHDNRPSTHAGTPSSTHSEPWTTEFERVRHLRDAQSAHLKALKQERHDLKKSLKTSNAALHEMEKRTKPQRRRTLLHKRRPAEEALAPPLPSTPKQQQRGETPEVLSSSGNTPSRPATSGGYSLLTGLTASPRLTTPGPRERPKSSLLSDSRPWSMFSFSSSTPEKRPGTGYSSMFGTPGNNRPVTSGGLMGEVGAAGGKDTAVLSKAPRGEKKRVWSERLRELFRREK